MISAIQRTVVNTVSSNWGCSCVFFRVGEFGVKLYQEKSERNGQFYRQQTLAAHNIAPKCWLPFTVSGPIIKPLRDRRRVWHKAFGFVTEVAEPIAANNAESWDRQYDQETEDFLKSDELDALHNAYYKAMRAHYIDDHTANYGRLKSKLVIID